ncbi:BamA/TamA family outer membrane protein [Arachidicoccus terrestris]|uniref:BamA/TamA family outer membrane protein n=1 Tax=Arachidicoccus terrestris TaxID=2875539 RepID=UPI001CC4CB83|nr:BamA/TamA family outer membrane protein [Arachidicoccus terrestris]UAY54475.1 BamA/TamA family outer membrane protein [Arachidicoccus terrestris]
MHIKPSSRYMLAVQLWVAGLIMGMSACVTVKNPPVGQPFVYDSKIELKSDNLSKEEAKLLKTNLAEFWVDSLRPPKVQRYFVAYRIVSPPVFDTAGIEKSIQFMDSYMNSAGYYQATFKDSVRVDSTSAPGQKRVTVTMYVDPNKAMIIDSLGYGLADTALQRIAMDRREASAIVPHKTKFTKENIATELDRLVKNYRNLGYYRISRNNLIAETDTTDAALLKLTLDPFEQAIKMAQAAARTRENPSAVVIVKERPPEDTTLVSSRARDFVRYRVGHINFFPETASTEIPDSILRNLHAFSDVFETRRRHVSIYNKEGKFIPKPMLSHLYMREGDYYSDTSFYKTINNLSAIGAWQQVDYRNFLHGDSVDMNFFLVPAVKQNVTVDLEGSWNTGDFVSSSNMFGLALNLTHRNRNVWKRAIQSLTNLRTGVELNLGQSNSYSNRLLQTLQIAGSHSYSFPRFIAPFRLRSRNLDAIRTVVSVNGSYTDRKDYFQFRSFVTNWGYEWKKGNASWQYRPINFELYSLDVKEGLVQAMEYNPYLKNAFNTGTVLSQQLNYNVSYPNTRFPGNNYFRVGVEESGTLFGLIPALRDQIYRYFRVEGEYIKHFDFAKTQLALRGFAGVGVNYRGKEDKFGGGLPFYKQFIAGGPNSMRAWGLRQLGLGSNLQSDTSSTFRDRYGDMQLEVNLEYRYPIFSIGGVKFNGAVFTDIGNIWNVRKDESLPDAEFSIGRLGKDLAIALGTGIRMDFNFVVIRVDFGLKLKDPARLKNNGWMSIRHFTWRNKEFEDVTADNPITHKPLVRNNYGIQLGIGLPF